MKRALKIIGKILLVIIALGIAFFIYVASRPAMPSDFQTAIDTGGAIEAKYLATGSYAVSYYEEPVLQLIKKYQIHYPSNLTNGEKKYPVIVVNNGSGTPASKFSILQEKLASWGFIVIATEETYAWNGFGAEISLRHLIRLNEKEVINDKKNIFYNKVDLERIGIMGHSQGAIGVFNAISENKHGYMYKAGVALSPTKIELADALEWKYDVSGIKVPMLLLSGTDEGPFIDPLTLSEIYNALPADTPKFMATRDDVNHDKMLYYSHGYVTAWFMWQLQGDSGAAKAFDGQRPEIMNNMDYQNQKSSLSVSTK